MTDLELSLAVYNLHPMFNDELKRRGAAVWVPGVQPISQVAYPALAALMLAAILTGCTALPLVFATWAVQSGIEQIATPGTSTDGQVIEDRGNGG